MKKIKEISPSSIPALRKFIDDEDRQEDLQILYDVRDANSKRWIAIGISGHEGEVYPGEAEEWLINFAFNSTRRKMYKILYEDDCVFFINADSIREIHNTVADHVRKLVAH